MTETEKKSTLHHEDVFEYRGHKFKVEFEPEIGAEAPWDWGDGPGPVRYVRRKEDKRPGERILAGNIRDGYHLYDFAEAVKIAKTQWGVTANEHYTQGQNAATAAEKDFEYLKGGCSDEWQYVTCFVTLLDETGHGTDRYETLGMIESNQHEYLTETAYELADNILVQLEKDHDKAVETRESQIEELVDIAYRFGLKREARERFSNFLTNHFGPVKS